MEDDFGRIDAVTTAILGEGVTRTNSVEPEQNGIPHPNGYREEKMWVVFRGKRPGIYNL